MIEKMVATYRFFLRVPCSQMVERLAAIGIDLGRAGEADQNFIGVGHITAHISHTVQTVAK